MKSFFHGLKRQNPAINVWEGNNNKKHYKNYSASGAVQFC